MKTHVKILGFVGSLRKGSYNKALMRAALELLPENAALEVFDLEEFHHLTKIWRTNLPL